MIDSPTPEHAPEQASEHASEYPSAQASEHAPEGPAPDDAGSAPHRHIRSFSGRRGRMTLAQAEALETLWPEHGMVIDGSPVDPDALFGGLPVVLEIGFGMGDATEAMALADPGTGILAVDVHPPGHGSLLHRIDRSGLENVRVASGDAVVLLRDSLPEGALAGIRVYFPDPWPKARHHKRRIIRPELVRLMASRLAPGGTLHCATDWEEYAGVMLEVLSDEPLLRNRYGGGGDGDRGVGGGFAPRPEWRPVTKFERQGLAKGHRVNDLIFERV